MTIENNTVQQILEVMEIHDTVEGPESGCYKLKLRVIMNGVEEEVLHFSRPDDPHGINPIIRQWLSENPDAVVISYTPPTVEEIRQSLPPLTRRQFKLGMIGAGLSLDLIETAISAIEDPMQRSVAQIEWQDATTFERMHPLVINLSSSLGLTPEQVDTMWQGAHQI